MNEAIPKRKRGPSRLFLRAFEAHNDQVKALIGIEYTKATLTKFKTVRAHAQAFIRTQYGKPDLHIRQITPAFVADFEFWLKSARRIDHNTTMKYVACVRKIVLRALRSGWITRDPFLGISLAPHEVHRQALTETELAALIKVVLPTRRLERTRDIFLFCCYTGLAYADVRKLRRTDIFTGVDREPWLSIRRQKTETPARVPLLPAASAILGRYSGYRDARDPDRVLPVASNQKMNDHLREIADLAGISKHMTMHLARHTFATTVTLNNGVPMETVSKMLGHRNLKATQLYAKIVDRKVSQDMAVIRAKFSGDHG
jgi:site-specific recombinase XerD